MEDKNEMGEKYHSPRYAIREMYKKDPRPHTTEEIIAVMDDSYKDRVPMIKRTIEDEISSGINSFVRVEMPDGVGWVPEEVSKEYKVIRKAVDWGNCGGQWGPYGPF